MPANLPQPFHQAGQAYRRATTLPEEFACLQKMLQELPRHKGTEKMQADLKQKISRVKSELDAAAKNLGKRGFRLPRQGAGRAVMVGGPNGGKSQLLASLSNAKPAIAEYPFTTREPQPAMMPWQDVAVQLVDTPPVTADVYDPVTQELIRGADLVLLVLDLGTDDGGQQLNEVWDRIQSSKSRLGQTTMLDEQQPGTTWTRGFLVANKIDLPEAADRLAFFSEELRCDLETFHVSARQGTQLEPLRDAIYQAMDVVRVYTKLPTRKSADLDSPFTLPRGQTVLDLARLVHQDVADHFRFARVWGSQVHDGTQVRADHVLADRDIVELHR